MKQYLQKRELPEIKMKNHPIFFILLLLFSTGIYGSGINPEGKDLFPEVEGFLFDGEINSYSPDTLYEYINGGADLFLNFEFNVLYSVRYKNS